MEDAEGTTCYGPGSVAGAVIGTFLATCILIALAALVYRQWRRNKGKHLVLVTDPEIVEEAYAFDNPCFKDSATPTVARSLERPTSIVVETPASHHGKDTRWSTAWSNLRHDKRRTLDDSVVTPKATRVSVVGLRSRDFTGLGFNVCGNMREGIYVKDLLHRGPASESGCIHPGDRILSVKISFRSMVYEDALTILSYASPYEVELEVESGGPVTSKPTTLMKKSVGPTPLCLYHPLFRSQSIPQLFPQQAQSQHFSSKKRLFAADPLNDSIYSNVSSLGRPTSNKSTPEVGKEHGLNHSHPKFGIKVLPALDSTVHRVQNDNEHNTNLERRHSKKLEEKRHSANGSSNQVSVSVGQEPVSKVVNENVQQKSASSQVPLSVKRVIHVGDGLDVPDRAAEVLQTSEDAVSIGIPSEVPAEVHNAGMAARGKRKSSGLEMVQDPSKMQQLQQQHQEATQQQQQQQEALEALNEAKSPQKGKRKAPAPPSRSASIEVPPTDTEDDKTVVLRTKTTDETSEQTNNESAVGEVPVKTTENEESESQPSDKPKPQLDQPQIKRITSLSDTANRRISESDTDSEIQNSFTTIELNSSDITVHHTPVPDATPNDDEEDDEDDVYRKAASLGDLSKYEAKSNSAALLERAQSLDMTEASNAKKRKAPMPPAEDISESTEDLTKLDQKPAPSVTIDGRSKLKKSSEWGTLEDAIWSGNEKPAERKRSIASNSGGGTLERSKSNVEIKTAKDEGGDEEVDVSERLNVSDGAIETSLELYNLPLSKKLTQDFIRAERLFNPEEDNALARIINDGSVLKSPTPEQVDLEFRLAHPLPDPDDDSDEIMEIEVSVEDEIVSPTKYVNLNASKKSPTTPDDPFKIAIRDFDASMAAKPPSNDTIVVLGEAPEVLYKGKKEVVEEPMTKVTLNMSCPGCDHRHGRHNDHCAKRKSEEKEQEYHHQTIKVIEEPRELDSGAFETHFAKPVIGEDEDDEETVTVNKDQQQEQHNVSNISVSSGENSSEDSGLAGLVAPSKTYVMEIKVPPSEDSENEEIVAILEGSNNKKSPPQQVQVTSNGKLPPGKKPPVPPRRSDATRLARENSDKQVVFVSEYKSPMKQQQQQEEKENKMENSWVIVKDAKEKQEVSNPWGNGSAGPAQPPVTNIVLASSTPTGEEKNTRK